MEIFHGNNKKNKAYADEHGALDNNKVKKRKVERQHDFNSKSEETKEKKLIVRIWRTIKDFVVRFNNDDIMALGSQLAYNFLLSFFPFLIFLMTLIAYTPVKSQDILIGLQKLLPVEAYTLIHKTVAEIINTKSPHLLSIGLIIAIWTSTSGFTAVIKGLNKAYDENEKRPFWKVQLISLICTLALAFIIMASFTLLIFGEVNGKILANYLGFTGFFIVWNVLRYLVILLVMLLLFAALYHYTPCRKLTWKEVFPGAAFSAIGWIICSELFSYYVNNFANYSMFYGSIGAVIIFMTWLFLNSEIILIGGEINATLSFCKQCKVE